jgi:ATP-dependent DNA helicase RecQ
LGDAAHATVSIISVQKRHSFQAAVDTHSQTMDDNALIKFVQIKQPEILQLHNGQGNVVRKLNAGESCLAVIPTGGGKSLLWLLYTAIASSKHSGDRPLCVVLVPYKALILNHIEASKPWFQGQEIVSSEDTETIVRQNIDRAHIVYTTPEKYVRSTAFKRLIDNQRSRIQLIVYDEVHLLQEQSKFRPDMVDCVVMLARVFPSTIRLALTATQEISQTQSLLEVAQMPENTSIERCSCNRNNCHIEIVAMRDLKNKQKETQFQYDSLDMFQRFNRAERPQAIIFVISKREAENLCCALQSLCTDSTQISANEVTFFHADLESQARKDRMHTRLG